MKKVLPLFLLYFSMVSCNQQKEYKYVEQVREKDVFGKTSLKDKDAELIHALSDTLAYIAAYDKYILSQVAKERVREKLIKEGIEYQDYSTIIGFKLINPEGKDISNIHFTTKKAQEKKIVEKWDKHKSPNSYTQSNSSSNEPQLGDWRINNYVDEFNETTSVKYVRQSSMGTFSNSATTNSDLIAIILIDKYEIRFQLLEYGSHYVKASETMKFKVKDNDGEIIEFKAIINESGYIVLSSDKQKGHDALLAALLKGGEVKFYGIRDYYGRSTYNFSFYCDFLQNALNQI